MEKYTSTQKCSSKNITIATGASPFVPKIDGLDKITPLTSENLWELKELPKKLLVLGGGPIGCEMAQAFNRLGSEVHIYERGDRLISKEDPKASEVILKTFKDEGVHVHLNSEVTGFKSSTLAIYKNEENDLNEIDFDQCLFALGRKANTKGFGLEKLGLEFNEDAK